MSQPNRSSNKNVVSEQENKVEEAIDIAAKDCTAARNLHSCSSEPPSEFCTKSLTQLLQSSYNSQAFRST